MTLSPIPPSPNTTHLAPGFDLGGVDHRADAGRDAAADVADLVERRVGADLRHCDLRQHGEIREGRAAHVVMQLAAIEREARGAVRHHALALRAADRGAEVGLARQARRTLPALRRVERDDVVAGRRPRLLPGRPRPRRPRPRARGSPGTSLRDRRRSRVNSSVWQIPVALISTITSPALGPSSLTVATSSGLPASKATAALTSMLTSLTHLCGSAFYTRRGFGFTSFRAKTSAAALVAQLDRASDFESEGREFESLRARQTRYP